MDIYAVLMLLLPSLFSPVIQREITFSPVAPTSIPARTRESSLTSGSSSPNHGLNSTEEQIRVLAEAYLYSGNASLLSLANCSRAYYLSMLQGSPAIFRPFLRPALDALTNAANFLNMIFQANDLRESSLKEDMEWYHALVRGLLEGDPLIQQALLIFDAQPAAPQPQLVLRASRPSYKTQEILLQDLSSNWEQLYPPTPSPHANWYTTFKFLAPSQLAHTLSKRVLLNDLNTLDTPKWGQGDSYVTNQSGVHWAHGPFLECQGGRYQPGWLLTLSTSFYGLKPDLSPEFRGVIRLDVSLQNFDMDQCDEGGNWFSNTHQCNRTSMQCVPFLGRGFRLGQYRCHCKEGYYSPTPTTGDTRKANPVEGRTVNANGDPSPSLPVCLPCWPGCRKCENGAPCKVQEDWFLRMSVLVVQGFFMLFVLISMLVAYQFRTSKRIRASGLLLLETILFGSLLLYFPVFILYFKPSTFRCIVLRWVRLMGFAIVYGTLILKMYRVLKVFLSHTARRVPYMSNGSILKILGVVVLTVSWFLSAWTAGVLQNRDRNIPLLITSTTSDGQGFSLCELDRWDYMMAIAELLFLCWGSLLYNAVRTVPSAFHEPRYMGIAIHNELILSSTFHLLRFVMSSLHPDWMLLLFFTHTHVTVTVTLGLLFIPKFLHMLRPIQEEIPTEVYEDEMDVRYCSCYLESSFVPAWSEHSLDPDDIRDELKELYSQLEVHKTKKMTANNPHLQKKRSSQRGLGHSVKKHISEIQESMSRQCSCEDKEGSRLGEWGRQSGSCKNKALESGSVNSSERSFKKCIISLRKTQSTYDYVSDNQARPDDTKDYSILDSLMRKNLAKKTFESSNKSGDSSPLVYKSASAHNLSAMLQQTVPNKLERSWSIMMSNKQSAPQQPNKTRSLQHTQKISQEENPGSLDFTIMTQTANTILSASFDMADACPWELENHLPEYKNKNHLTYAISPNNGQRTPERATSNVMQCSPNDCIWQGEKPSSNKKKREFLNGREGSDSDSDSTKPQVPVSSSAPGSPVTDIGRPKKHRVLSLRGATYNFSLSVKRLMKSGKCSGSYKSKIGLDGKEKKQEIVRSKSQEKRAPLRLANSRILRKYHSKEEIYNTIPDFRVQQTHQKNIENVISWEEKKENPCLIKQTTITLSSNASHRRTAKEKDISNICPWEARKKECTIITPGNIYENICSKEIEQSDDMEKEINARESICPWEIDEDVANKEDKDIKKGCETPVITTTKKSTGNLFSIKSDLGLRYVIQSSHQAPQKKQSSFTDICPWDMEEWVSSPVRQIVARPSLKGVKEKTYSEKVTLSTIHHWEPDAIEIMTTRQKSSGNFAGETHANTASKEGPKKYGPMPVITSPVEKCLDENPRDQETFKAVVSPWDNSTQQDSQKQKTIVPSVCSLGMQKQNQVTLHTEICPWDTDGLEKSTGALGVRNQNKKEYNLTPTIFGSTDKSVDEIPLDVSDLPHEEFQKLQGNIMETYPWETKKSEMITRQDSGHSNFPTHEDQKKETYSRTTSTFGVRKSNERFQPNADVCPWDVPESYQQTTQRQQSSIAEICPWDMGGIDPHYVKEGEECPVKALEGMSIKQDCAKNCSGEMEELERITKKKCESVCADISTRKVKTQEKVTMYSETSELKQLSNVADVCPWDIPTSPINTVDIYPWEVNDPKPCLARQTAISLCSEKSHSLETIKKTDSVFGDTCLHKANRSDTITKSQEIDICLCKIEQMANMVKKQESIRADVCPWEAYEPEETKIGDCTHASICPRKQKEMEKAIQKQDSFRVDICPWDKEEVTPFLESETLVMVPTSAIIITGKQSSVLKIPDETNTQGEVSPWEVGITGTSSGDKKALILSKNQDPQQSTAIAAAVGVKLNMPLARRDALCPWKLEDINPQHFKKDNTTSDIPSLKDEDVDAESEAEAFYFPTDC